MNVLRNIIRYKRVEISRKKKITSIRELLKGRHSELRDFTDGFNKHGIALIAEIKRMSPSRGVIRKCFEPSKIALIYESGGADAISVLTDERFFGGKGDHIEQVKKMSSLPILRKDFIIEEFQIFESYFLGADAVLLIARILGLDKLKNFINIAHSLGLKTLVEVHTQQDIKKAITTETDIIGINNRNLGNFQVDINLSLKLRKIIPDHFLTVSESGIKDRRDVKMLENAGFDGILIGTSLLRARNIEKKLSTLIGER